MRNIDSVKKHEDWIDDFRNNCKKKLRGHILDPSNKLLNRNWIRRNPRKYTNHLLPEDDVKRQRQVLKKNK